LFGALNVMLAATTDLWERLRQTVVHLSADRSVIPRNNLENDVAKQNAP
jgi:hypothetical protein